MNGDQRTTKNNVFPNVTKKNHHSQRIIIFSHFLSFFFCRELIKTKLFFVKFDKEQSFFLIPAILFSNILFFFDPLVFRMVTNQCFVYNFWNLKSVRLNENILLFLLHMLKTKTIHIIIYQNFIHNKICNK